MNDANPTILFPYETRFLPLGRIDPDGGMTLGDTLAGTPLRGLHLPDEYRDLLEDHDVLFGDAPRTHHQLALLAWMSSQRVVMPVLPDAPEVVLDLIPVLRRTFTAVDDLGDDGYRVHTSDGIEIRLDELEARILVGVNGSWTFRSISDAVLVDLLGSGQKAAIAEAEQTEGRRFEAILCEAALRLTLRLLRVGVMTVDETGDRSTLPRATAEEFAESSRVPLRELRLSEKGRLMMWGEPLPQRAGLS